MKRGMVLRLFQTRHVDSRLQFQCREWKWRATYKVSCCKTEQNSLQNVCETKWRSLQIWRNTWRTGHAKEWLIVQVEFILMTEIYCVPENYFWNTNFSGCSELINIINNVIISSWTRQDSAVEISHSPIWSPNLTLKEHRTCTLTSLNLIFLFFPLMQSAAYLKSV